MSSLEESPHPQGEELTVTVENKQNAPSKKKNKWAEVGITADLFEERLEILICLGDVLCLRELGWF